MQVILALCLLANYCLFVSIHKFSKIIQGNCWQEIYERGLYWNAIIFKLCAAGTSEMRQRSNEICCLPNFNAQNIMYFSLDSIAGSCVHKFKPAYLWVFGSKICAPPLTLKVHGSTRSTHTLSHGMMTLSFDSNLSCFCISYCLPSN